MTHSSSRRTKSSFWSKLATVAILALLCSTVAPFQTAIATPGVINCPLTGTYTVIAGEASNGSTCAGALVIPEGVSSIAANAFREAPLTSIEIPASVTAIGTYAFNSASELSSVTFKEGSLLEYIGSNAFQSATKLESITIPSTVTSIEFAAFAGTDNLTSVVFSPTSSLESIGQDAFYGATSLASIAIPSSVTSIGMGAFEEARALTAVTFEPDSALTSIGENAFLLATSLTSIRIPSGVTAIRAGTFLGAESLVSISIPSGVTLIGNEAFRNTLALESVTFEPDSTLETIGDSAFSIYDSGSGSLTSISIPNTVTLIGNGAFQNSALRSILFQEGIDPLEIDIHAFKDADFLESIEIPNRVTEIGEGAFSFTNALRSVTFAPGINLSELSRQLFWRADSLNAITIPDSVFSIGERAFAETGSLTSVTFGPASILRNILRGAFENSTALEEIEIPATVDMIDDDAFASATSLTAVRFGADSILGSLGDNAFRGASSLAHIDLPDNDLEVAKYAFYGTAPSLFSSSYINWKSPLLRSSGSPDIGDKVYASAFEKELSITGLGPHVDEYVYRITLLENVITSSVDRQAITSYTPLDKDEQDAWYEDLGFDEISPYEFSWRAFMCVKNEDGTSTVTRPTNLSLSYASRDVIPVGTSSQNHWALFRTATQALHLDSSPSTRTVVGKIYDGGVDSPPKGSDMYELDYNNSPYSLGISEVHATCGTGKTLEALQIVQPEEVGTNPITTKELEITPVLRLAFEGEYFTENSAGLTIGVTGGGGGGPEQFGGSYNAALWGLTTIAGGVVESFTENRAYESPRQPIQRTEVYAFRGFAGNSSNVPASVRRGVEKLTSGFRKVVRVECTGYTSGTVPNRWASLLARNRAKAACNLVKKEFPDTKVQLRVKPATGVGEKFRRVQVKVSGS